MHELSIATNIVEIVQDNLASYAEAKVHSVTVQVGTHSGIEPEALFFCFPIACENTPVHGAKLILEIVPLTITCSQCDTRHIQTETLRCPKCQSIQIEVIAGKDMIVSSIDLDIIEENHNEN